MHLPAREVPVPLSVSAAARAIIAIGPLRAQSDYPRLDDHDAWRKFIVDEDAQMMQTIGGRFDPAGVEVTERSVGGVSQYVATPEGIDADDHRIFLDIHGGALILGGGELCRLMAIGNAKRVRARVWAVDYRMPPDHPYPTPLDDCVAAYRAVLEEHRPEDVIVGGASAGGNLAAATVLRARDEGLPLPGGLVLMTPEADLTESGDSFVTNLGLDPLLTRSLMPANLLYANGADLSDPYLSPLFGDFAPVDGKPGFPPTFLSSGTRDLFLSNTVLMHRALRRAGVPAELHVLEAAGHGGFLGMAPEDDELNRELRAFTSACWGRS
jgi:acetyl esterase/lipase